MRFQSLFEQIDSLRFISGVLHGGDVPTCSSAEAAASRERALRWAAISRELWAGLLAGDADKTGENDLLREQLKNEYWGDAERSRRGENDAS